MKGCPPSGSPCGRAAPGGAHLSHVLPIVMESHRRTSRLFDVENHARFPEVFMMLLDDSSQARKILARPGLE
jgi:hypothetical protein